jgi:transglutaminase-like putative cysteine protease
MAMTKFLSVCLLTLLLSLVSSDLFSQYKLQFGDISPDELSNKPYEPDPGADAIILSDVGIASLNYVNEFYIELERDIRIRIVNSNGYDYANIEIPVAENEELLNLRASTFNLKNGEKAETKVGKKSIIIEKATINDKIVKFNFPDVHEGSVVEYSYIIRMKREALFTLVPWKFQSDIPEMFSSVTITYPAPCKYKVLVYGSAELVSVRTAEKEAYYFGQKSSDITARWAAENVPAFRNEPYIKSKKEHLTRLSFELLKFDFPGVSSSEEYTPTYSSLTQKLLEKRDFGLTLNADFKSLAEKITKDSKDDLTKLKKIQEYVSTNILWNGVSDYTASQLLKTVLRKQKGNSADINMLLIAMLRSINIKADPLILCTRSNGSLNTYSAMIQQFNYLVAYVFVDGEYYLVDATDPLRPFNILPFDCLNGSGRLISEYDSKFIDLKNQEKQFSSTKMILNLDQKGELEGTSEDKYSDYLAYSIRKLIKNEGEDGYLDIVKSSSADVVFDDIKIENSRDIYSDLIRKCKVKIISGAEVTNDEIIISPNLTLTRTQNPFKSVERKFPVDFGCPLADTCSLSIKIPEGFSVTEMPEDISFDLGKKTDASFVFKCRKDGDKLNINYVFNINKTIFQPEEYTALRNFYSKILKKQAELIILKKTS